MTVVMNDWSRWVLSFMFCEFLTFWLNNCNRVESVLIGSVPVFLCSQSRA
jgi:hypothetical protein